MSIDRKKYLFYTQDMNRKYLSPKIRSAHFETESESIFIDLVRDLFPTLSTLALSKLANKSVLGGIVTIAYAVYTLRLLWQNRHAEDPTSEVTLQIGRDIRKVFRF